MKKFLFFCAFVAVLATGNAQSVVDNFTVGPYIVDYNGQGDVKYRLRDNINLYEFFELKKDTTVVIEDVETPLLNAVQISGYLGSTRYQPKELGISGVWKHRIATNLYLNAGLSLAFDLASASQQSKRTMLELGIPLQIELGKLNHQKASLYGSFGITPAFYSTMSAKIWMDGAYVKADKDLSKSGFMIAPALEFGGNIPVGNLIMRIGVYGTYKINCTTGSYDVYKNSVGRCLLGAKIGLVI